MPIQLSVVISSFNDGPLLRRTIDPLLADPATAEVIIVVDGSTDGSYEALAEWACDEPRLRPFLIENRGRPGARQYGIERARSEVVLLIDSDVIATQSLVSGHGRHHEDGSPRLVLGYMPVSPPPKRPGSFVIEHYSRVYEQRCADYERDPAEILRGLWGGNMSLPRRSLEAAGGFDGNLGLDYNEDLELGLRLAKTGIEPVFDRTLRGEHLYERSVSGFLAVGHEHGAALVQIGVHHPGEIQLPVPIHSRLDEALCGLSLRPRFRRLLLCIGTKAIDWAGRLGAHGLEERLGHRLEALGVAAGMRAARAGLRLRAVVPVTSPPRTPATGLE